MAYGKLGRYPLYIDSAARALKYWTRLLTLDDSRLPRQAYFKGRLNRGNKKGWETQLQQTLATNGLAYLGDPQNHPPPPGTHNMIKQRLIDQFKQNWHSMLETHDRYDTYRTFKDKHERERYITDIRIAKYRKQLTRLRFGITEINSNNKYTNPLKPKNCPFCNTPEDEEHFLLACPTYDSLRLKYISKHWLTLNNTTTTDLLQSDNKNITLRTALYIDKALCKREQLTTTRDKQQK